MVNRSAVGQSSNRFAMSVEKGKIREFARATGSDNPAYMASATPVVPPTFLATQAIWQDAQADPWVMAELHLDNSLHAEQEYVFHGPLPRAGAELSFQTTIEDIYAKPARRGGALTFVVAVTRFYDWEGRLVAESKATGVETEGQRKRP